MYKEIKAEAGNVQVAQGAIVVGARQKAELANGSVNSALAHAKITIEQKLKRAEEFSRARTVRSGRSS